jgi:hypothetical protein
MNHAQLQALSGQFRARHKSSRVEREKAEMRHGLVLLGMGLFGALIVVGVLIYAFS